MGLIANVYRRAGDTYDCTAGGWSSRVNQVIIENASGPFIPESYTEYMPVRLIKHPTMNALHVKSVADLDAGRWTMFGGNYIACSDSRFGELIAQLLGPQYQYACGAIPIHDRFEG